MEPDSTVHCVQAERAEREEVMLRSLLSNLRNELNSCLHASSGLERSAHQLTYENLNLRGESVSADTHSAEQHVLREPASKLLPAEQLQPQAQSGLAQACFAS